MKQPKRTKVYQLLKRYQPDSGRAFRRDIKIPAVDTILEPTGDGNLVEKMIAYERSMPLYVEKWNRDALEVKENPPARINWSSSVVFTVNPAINPKLADYMDKCNFNLSNPHRDTSIRAIFEEIDTDKRAQEAIIDDKDETLAKAAAYDLDIDKLREVITMFGYPTKNPFGELLTENEVRERALRAAEADAVAFNEVVNDPRLNYRINVNRALAVNVIYADQDSHEVRWTDNDKPVKGGRIPMGVTPTDYLVKHISDGAGGKSFYDELISRIMGDKETADEISKKFRGAKEDYVESLKPEQLLDKAMELGVIIRKTPYYILEGLGDKGRICKSKSDAILAIKNNVEISGVELATSIKTQIKVASV